MKNILEFLSKALIEANKSIGIYKLGAIIINKNNMIIASGFNNYIKSHPIQALYAKRIGKPNKIYLHAEIHALIKCRRKPYAIFVMRKIKLGSGISKPCQICMLAIKESGIKKIIYQDKNNQIKTLTLF